MVSCHVKIAGIVFVFLEEEVRICLIAVYDSNNKSHHLSISRPTSNDWQAIKGNTTTLLYSYFWFGSSIQLADAPGPVSIASSLQRVIIYFTSRRRYEWTSSSLFLSCVDMVRHNHVAAKSQQGVSPFRLCLHELSERVNNVLYRYWNV